MWNCERLAEPVEHIICFFLLCNIVGTVITEFIQVEQSSLLHLHYLSVHICFMQFLFPQPWQMWNCVNVKNIGPRYQFWKSLSPDVTLLFLIFEKTSAALHIVNSYVEANGSIVIVTFYTRAYNTITDVSYQSWGLNFWFVTSGGIPGNSLLCILGRLNMLQLVMSLVTTTSC